MLVGLAPSKGYQLDLTPFGVGVPSDYIVWPPLQRFYRYALVTTHTQEITNAYLGHHVCKICVTPNVEFT